MSDATPVRVLVLVQIAGLAVLLLWFATEPPAARTRLLLQVWQAEQGLSWPPQDVLEQLEWLVTHRQARLQRVSVLLGLVLLIGIGEGWALRARDTLQGFRFAWWTVGVCSLALLPGVVGGMLFVPWPLPLAWIAIGGSVMCGMVGWSLTLGRPRIA